MALSEWTPKPPIYYCEQYDGTNAQTFIDRYGSDYDDVEHGGFTADGPGGLQFGGSGYTVDLTPGQWIVVAGNVLSFPGAYDEAVFDAQFMTLDSLAPGLAK